MSNALQIAATGMQAQQANLETIANNLSNVNTPGFKRSRVSFVDLMLQAAAGTAGLDSDVFDPATTLLSRIGGGVGITGMLRHFESGELKKTDSPFDLAIRGDGFLEVSRADGSSAFWRAGTLKVNSEGQLTTQSGLVIKPGIAIPDNAQAINVGADGRVQVTVPGQSAPIEVGQLQMARFASAAELEALGDNLYLPTSGSGEAVLGRPGEDGLGSFAQGYIEASNVKLVDEMVNLMQAQRAYQASLKVLQAEDERSALTNNLRK